MADKLLKEVFTIEFVTEINWDVGKKFTINVNVDGVPVDTVFISDDWEITDPVSPKDRAELKRILILAQENYCATFSKLLHPHLVKAVEAAYILTSDRLVREVFPSFDSLPVLADLIGNQARELAREQQQLPGRGRPSKHTKAKLEKTIRQGVGSYRRKNYGRSPTLPEVANELQMPVATLKSLLHRHGLRYSTYKKDA